MTNSPPDDIDRAIAALSKTFTREDRDHNYDEKTALYAIIALVMRDLRRAADALEKIADAHTRGL